MKFAYVLAALVVVFSGCVTHKSQPQLGYTVTLPQPNRIRFSGKGAGAGVMMASTVGPMGIAIGVAIDDQAGKSVGLRMNYAVSVGLGVKPQCFGP